MVLITGVCHSSEVTNHCGMRNVRFDIVKAIVLSDWPHRCFNFELQGQEKMVIDLVLTPMRHRSELNGSDTFD